MCPSALAAGGIKHRKKGGCAPAEKEAQSPVTAHGKRAERSRSGTLPLPPWLPPALHLRGQPSFPANSAGEQPRSSQCGVSRQGAETKPTPAALLPGGREQLRAGRGRAVPHPWERKAGRAGAHVYELHQQLLPPPRLQPWRPGPALTPPRAPQFTICWRVRGEVTRQASCHQAGSELLPVPS